MIITQNPTQCPGIGQTSYRSALPGEHDTCTECGRAIVVRKDGTVGKHKALVFDTDGNRTDR